MVNTGIASVAVIEGDPGSGKSRLIEELIKVCAQTGVGVAVGRADGLPFEPIKMMVVFPPGRRGRSPGDPHTPAARPVTRVSLELAPKVIRLRSTCPSPDRRCSTPSSRSSPRSARPSPMALVFDDFQWVDDESAAVFRALLAREWDCPGPVPGHLAAHTADVLRRRSFGGDPSAAP